MVTWQNRILLLCIPMLLQMACGSGSLQQPDLVAGMWQSADKKTQTQLNLVNWYSEEAATLDPKKLGDLEVVKSTGDETILLGFSEPLDGSLLETVEEEILQNKITPLNPPAIEIWSYDLTLQDQKQFKSFTLLYRPDGGYVPPLDAPISKFPPPAVMIQLQGALPPKSIIAIHVIAQKLSNVDQIFMDQVKNLAGTSIVSPGGSEVAGTIWFQTK